MEVSPVRHVKSTTKLFYCDWCGERIKKGEPCKTWFTYGENVTARMHPECFTAMQKADLYDEQLPPRGTYARGRWCGERKEHCTCTGADNLSNSAPPVTA